jgi:hypothetical protein
MGYEKDGVEFPSVTTILGILDKPALVGWAARTAIDYVRENIGQVGTPHFWDNAKESWRDLKKSAADHGTEVHALAEEWIKGGDPMPTTDEAQTGFEALKATCQSMGLTFLHSEHTVFSNKGGYAGTLDAVAKDASGKLCLIDFKTSSGVYPEMKSQVSMYANAYEEMTGTTIDRQIIIRIDRETGTPEVVDCTAGHAERISAAIALVDYYYRAAARRLKNNPHAKARMLLKSISFTEMVTALNQPIGRGLERTSTLPEKSADCITGTKPQPKKRGRPAKV